MSAPASSSRMSDVGAPPPCVSLPAVVVGGMLGPPVTPRTPPAGGPPVIPETTPEALEAVVDTELVGVLAVVVTELVGVLAVVVTEVVGVLAVVVTELVGVLAVVVVVMDVLDELSVLELDELSVLELDELSVLELDELSVLELDELSVLELDEDDELLDVLVVTVPHSAQFPFTVSFTAVVSTLPRNVAPGSTVQGSPVNVSAPSFKDDQGKKSDVPVGDWSHAP